METHPGVIQDTTKHEAVRLKDENIQLMKGRESGMPREHIWESFFDAPCVLERLVTRNKSASLSVAEFGSGYATFTLPLARMTSGQIHAIDIEPRLIERLSMIAAKEGINNIVPLLRDFTSDGSGLPNECVDHAMLYNILHIEDPISLLTEAYRIVRRGGMVSIIHWRTDVPTPRGPSPGIRPSPAQIHSWLIEAGFSRINDVELDCAPYHFGIRAIRPSNTSPSNRKAEE